MKKHVAVLVALPLVIAIIGLTNNIAFASESDLAQEAERNRELLEIWKDHVKTLTKERDDAYRQIERLKAGGVGTPAGQFGIETTPIPAPPEAIQQIDSLQSEVTLFDQFAGKNIPEGKRSLAFSLAYQKQDATFTDSEVQALQQRIGEALKNKFQVEFR